MELACRSFPVFEDPASSHLPAVLRRRLSYTSLHHYFAHQAPNLPNSLANQPSGLVSSSRGLSSTSFSRTNSYFTLLGGLFFGISTAISKTLCPFPLNLLHSASSAIKPCKAVFLRFEGCIRSSNVFAVKSFQRVARRSRFNMVYAASLLALLEGDNVSWSWSLPRTWQRDTTYWNPCILSLT